MQISQWSKQWESGEALILPNWYPEDQLSFGVLQYSNLDEEQFRAKETLNKFSDIHRG
jgi:hypothetical protein